MTPAELLAYNPAFDDDFDQGTFLTLEDDDLASAVLDAEEGSGSINVENIVLLTSRMAQLLAEEADLLAQMKISSLEALQDEKQLLTNALDKQRKLLDRNPHLLSAIDQTDRIRLEHVVAIFEDVMRENHRRLLVAREVNKKVVEAISASVYEASSNGFYNKKGYHGVPHSPYSMTLDERI